MDGLTRTSAVSLGSISNDQAVSVGRKLGGGDQYIGDMDEVRVEVGPTSTSADTTSPTVTARTPADRATGVGATVNVTATFSEKVQGVDSGTFVLTDPTGAVVPAALSNPTGNKCVLNPDASVVAGTRYTATLTGGTGPTGIRDAVNNALAPNPQSWSFTVAGTSGADTTPPALTAHTPTGVTGISRTANVTATFSEPVKNVTTSTFTLWPAGGGTPVAATVSFNATSGRWVLNPSATLGSRTSYTATVSTDVTDNAGNHLATTATWTFTTGA